MTVSSVFHNEAVRSDDFDSRLTDLTSPVQSERSPTGLLQEHLWQHLSEICSLVPEKFQMAQIEAKMCQTGKIPHLEIVTEYSALTPL